MKHRERKLAFHGGGHLLYVINWEDVSARLESLAEKFA